MSAGQKNEQHRELTLLIALCEGVVVRGPRKGDERPGKSEIRTEIRTGIKPEIRTGIRNRNPKATEKSS